MAYSLVNQQYVDVNIFYPMTKLEGGGKEEAIIEAEI
jgi:hypothetical protein